MQEKNFREIVASHRSKGYINEREAVTIVDENLVKFDKYTLKLSRIKSSVAQINYYNAQIVKYLKTKTNLYKEVREFNQLFRFLDKLNIRDGYIKKMETPDFELFMGGKAYGIEVTRIYTGNDWVAEKIHYDVDAYKLSKDTYKDYIATSKYAQRVKMRVKENEVKVSAIKKAEFQDEEVVEIKNKIFEKIRKQLDDYEKFDFNYIFAEIVYSGYKQIKSYSVLNEEIQYFVSHLDANFGKSEFHLVLKAGNKFIDFDLKRGNYTEL